MSDQSRAGELASFLDSARVEDSRSGGIRVMTIHKSKGLEFDSVVLADLDRPLLRSQRDLVLLDRESALSPVEGVYRNASAVVRQSSEQLQAAWQQEQDRRLRDDLSTLYVAMTRARSALFLWLRPQEDVTSRAGTLSHAAILRHTLLESDGQTSYTSGALADLQDVVQDSTSGSKQETLALDAPGAVSSGGAPRRPGEPVRSVRPVVDLEELCRSSAQSGRKILRVETRRTRQIRRALLAGFDTLGAELVVDGVADGVRLRALFDELRRTPSLVPKREFRVLGNHENRLVSDVLERVWVGEGEGSEMRAFVLDTRGEVTASHERRTAVIREIAAAALKLDPSADKVLVVTLG